MKLGSSAISDKMRKNFTNMYFRDVRREDSKVFKRNSLAKTTRSSLGMRAGSIPTNEGPSLLPQYSRDFDKMQSIEIQDQDLKGSDRKIPQK